MKYKGGLLHEHRKYLALIAWNIRKNNRAVSQMVVSEAVRKAAEAQGFKFRGVKSLEK